MSEYNSCLNQGVLERISKILGDTNVGLTGAEISYFLQQCSINDVTPDITKWKRLYSAFANIQNLERSSCKILQFIKTVLHPSRFTDEKVYPSQNHSGTMSTRMSR